LLVFYNNGSLTKGTEDWRSGEQQRRAMPRPDRPAGQPTLPADPASWGDALGDSHNYAMTSCSQIYPKHVYPSAAVKVSKPF
jgi:hypothetical protein